MYVPLQPQGLWICNLAKRASLDPVPEEVYSVIKATCATKNILVAEHERVRAASGVPQLVRAGYVPQHERVAAVSGGHLPNYLLVPCQCRLHRLIKHSSSNFHLLLWSLQKCLGRNNLKIVQLPPPSLLCSQNQPRRNSTALVVLHFLPQMRLIFVLRIRHQNNQTFIGSCWFKGRRLLAAYQQCVQSASRASGSERPLMSSDAGPVSQFRPSSQSQSNI